MNGHATLNRFYRLVWSCVTQGWHVVSEATRGKTKGGRASSRVSGALASIALAGIANMAHAQQAPPAATQLPTGGAVVRGTASIGQTSSAQSAAMTINQSSQRAVINWNSFNVGQNASVTFNQPNANAVTLNRIADQNPSQVFGQINANGQVFLSNPSGIYFSPTAQANVGALTATTHSVSDDDFMAGNMVFTRNGATGAVVNDGRLNAALGGYIVLLAPDVRNAGVIVAQAGTVALAAGEAITLNFNGAGGLAGITTTPSAIASLIENKLAVQAPDGQIILSAVALNKLQAGVIRSSGSLEANSISHKGGVVTLEGDDITLTGTSRISANGATGGGKVLVGGDWQGSGKLRQATTVNMQAGATIDANATQQGDGGKVVLWSDVKNANSQTWANGSIKAEAATLGGNGGQVETSGHYLNVDNVQVSTNAAQGNAGQWLLDPYNIDVTYVGGPGAIFTSTAGTPLTTSSTNYQSAATSVIHVNTLNDALTNGNVTLQAGATGDGGTDAGNITLYKFTYTIPANRTLSLIAPGEIKSGSDVSAPSDLLISMGSSTSTLLLSTGATAPTGKLIAGLTSGMGTIQKEGVGLLEIQTTGGLYNKAIVINGGTLKFSSSNSSQAALNGTISASNTISINNGATLLDPSFTGGLPLQTMSGAPTTTLTIGSGGGTLKYDTAITNAATMDIVLNGLLTVNSTTPTVRIDSHISGTGGVTVTGGNTVVFNPWSSDLSTRTNTYTGTTTIDVGSTLQFGATGAQGSWGSLSAGPVVNNGALVFGMLSSTATNDISGTGSVAATASTGQTVLSGSLSYTGGSTGRLYLPNPNLVATAVTSGSGSSSRPYVSGTLPVGTTFVTLTQTFAAASGGMPTSTAIAASDVTVDYTTGVWSYRPASALTGVGTYSYGYTLTKGGLTYLGTTVTSASPIVITAASSSSNGSAGGSGSPPSLPVPTYSSTGLVTFQANQWPDGTYTIYEGPTQIGAPFVISLAVARGSSPFTFQLPSNLSVGQHTFTAVVDRTPSTLALPLGTYTVAALPTSSPSNSNTPPPPPPPPTASDLAAMNAAQIAALSFGDLASFDASQLSGLSATQLGALSRTQLGALSASQVAVLGAAQVRGLSAIQLAGLSSAQLGALTATQVAALGAAQLAGLSATQVGAMSTAQLGALTATQVAALGVAQLAGLSATQLGGLSNAQLSGLTAGQVATLGTPQLAALSATQVGGLSSTQLGALTANQVAALGAAQLAGLSATQLGGLSNAQLSGLTAGQVATLGTPQLAALSATQVGGLSSTQLGALTANQVAALGPAQLAGLSAAQLGGLSPTQLGALTATQVTALGAAQLAGLSAAQVANLSQTQLSALTATQVSTLGVVQLAGLSGTQMGALSSAQLGALTTSQLSSLGATQLTGLTAYQVGALSPAQWAALLPNQAAALNASQLSGLTASQIRGLSNAQVGQMAVSLTGNQLAALSSGQLSALSVNQTAQLNPGQLASVLGALNTTQVLALTPVQLGSLTSRQVQDMSNSQLGSLSAAQVAALSPVQQATLSVGQQALLSVRSAAGGNANTQGGSMSTTLSPAGQSNVVAVAPMVDAVVVTLPPSQVVSLSPTQVSDLSASQWQTISPLQLSVLQPQQLAGVTVDNMGRLSVDQVGAFTVPQLQALTPGQVSGLSPQQLQALRPELVQALTPTQLQVLSPEQIGVVTKVKAGATVVCSPGATGGCSAK